MSHMSARLNLKNQKSARLSICKCSIREHEQMCKFYNNATKFIRVHDYNGVNCIRVQYC